MEEQDISLVLEKLEEGYDIIENNFFKEQEDFIALGESMADLNSLPSLDIPLSIKEYFGGINV